MEDVKLVIIPTRTKAKISHELSFPIGAERISVSLATAAQFPRLVLHFKQDYFNGVRFGHYPFLRAKYDGRAKVNNLGGNPDIPLFNEWEITVWPVPRVLRHRIQRYIVDSALPQIRQWLDQRVHLAGPGDDTLTFLFDEKKEEFIPEHRAHPQPMRENPTPKTRKDPRP
jgi:hypothetical protein